MKRTKVLYDWFQFSAYKQSFIFKDDFELKETGTRTKIFAHVDNLYYKKLLIAEIAHSPHSEIINKNIIIIKFKNEILYRPDFEKIFYELLNTNSFKFNNFTRLDICIDFINFANGLKPQNLIDKFMTNKITKVGNKRFKLVAKQITLKERRELKTKNNHIYSYLRFGSNTSNISAYIYNKSLEIKEASQKNYITKLHLQTFNNTKNDIWRLEFSIKNFNDIVLYDLTGELLNFTPTFVISEYFKVSLFNLLIAKYFSFYNIKGSKQKTKPKKITLFKNIDTTFKIIFNNCDPITTRTDKNFIKTLENYNCELREQKKELAKYSDIILNNFIDKKNLRDWYNKKFN